jgi:NAD(P)-dependent dehydrogenase (short-subunit alcohol dehydrogenase family)
VSLTLEPFEDGTRVLMEEGPADLWSRIGMGGPLAEPMLRIRNTEALSRLRRVALRGGNPTDQQERDHDGPLRVLVTGGSSGIGLAAAHRLAERGARIALVARGDEGLAQALETFEDLEVEGLHTYSADTTDRDAITAAIDEAARDLGGLDAVVASAAGASFGPFLETDPEDFDATVLNTFTGTVNTVRAALPHLERSGGTMVIVGSIAGRVPQPSLAAYSAAKHAVRGFVESLRAELRDDGSPVALCQVDPWAVDTPLADNFKSATGLRPPDAITAYEPESVAIEIVESIERRRPRVTVGRRAALAAFAYDVARPAFELGLVLASRHLRSGGDRIAGRGGLDRSAATGTVRGPLDARRSMGAIVSLGRQTVRAALDRA